MSENPNWTRDELILALDLYLAHQGNPPGKGSKEVGELSDTLNALAKRLGATGDERFRNPAGVYMKMMNFRRLDPGYPGKGLQRGGAGDELVWQDFGKDASRCHAVAVAIREAVASGAGLAAEANDADDVLLEAEEGRLLTRLHLTRERSRKLVTARKAQFKKVHGRVYCEVCGFDFEKAYGARGRGFIECHHTKAIHLLRPGDRTRLEDLTLLCPNCHRMIHASRPWLTPEALRVLVQGGALVVTQPGN